MTFSRGSPSPTNRSRQARLAAPPPVETSLISASFLPTSSSPLLIAAATTIAVPCWSSWKTGILSFSRRARSTTKQSGALMSSRLMAPNVGSSFDTASTNSAGSFSLTSMSKASMFANFLNRTDLPSMTGFAASGPMSPSPRTAVPLVIIPTRLPLAVYVAACNGSL